MWFNYIKEKLEEESNLVYKLLEADDNNVGYPITYDYLLKVIDSNNINNFFKDNLDDVTFIIQGNPISLLLVLNECVNKCIDIIIDEENVALNTWIIKQYNDFLEQNFLNKPNIIISNKYDVKTKKAIVIGSESFCMELKSILDIELHFYEDE